MSEDKNSFVLYSNYFDILKDLSDADAGILFKAILNYQSNGILQKLPTHIEMAFKFIKNQFDIDEEKYARKIEKQRENGKLGGRPKKDKNPKNPTVFFETQKSLNDNDNDNDNDNVVVEEEKQKILNNFYGEFKNVFLNDSDYGKICGCVNNSAILKELLDELSNKIAQNDEKYKPYNENFPSAHYSHLMKFWKYRQAHPEKFIKTDNNGGIDDYSAALQRGIEMYRQKKREKAKSL